MTASSLIGTSPSLNLVSCCRCEIKRRGADRVQKEKYRKKKSIENSLKKKKIDTHTLLPGDGGKQYAHGTMGLVCYNGGPKSSEQRCTSTSSHPSRASFILSRLTSLHKMLVLPIPPLDDGTSDDERRWYYCTSPALARPGFQGGAKYASLGGIQDTGLCP
ncbi:hypothetical protein PDE_00556 [Penicillium oxalicum 114-2]|uniref:Uncharacterized protein n=1 Tax=Penicillium oxalicum (strain 114-2 / CGMCC 5302) TaxID=933388 RepID=S8AUT5_PENO1|nr:hypothetical protein PDE_00556 [Penicillium oxalicum 114-2]